MNIFIFDKDPIIAASYVPNCYTVKMPIESAQMLCTTSHYFGVPAPYKISYLNHPCTRWIRESLSNYNWLINHAIALCEEYTKRYEKIHASQKIIEFCLNCGGKPEIDKGLTPFVQAMPDNYRNSDAVIAYRNYFIGEKSKIALWKPPSTIPYWFKPNS